MRRVSNRRGRKRYVAGTLLAVAAFAGGVGCEYDDSDWRLDQGSGATATRGGTRSSSGGGASGLGGADPSAYPAPSIDAMEPTSGPYGTLVTIRGSGLGNSALSGFTLAVGNQGEVELTPESDQAVVSWSDEEIVFRYPFPAEGAVSLEGPHGAALAGEFAPTWHIARELELAPAATVLASISSGRDQISLLLDTMPLTLLDVNRDAVVEHAVTASEIETTSLRLYLNPSGIVEGIAVSTGTEPVLVHLENQGGELTATPTSVQLQATEYGLAGGSEGASVWMNREDGWYRARLSAGAWTVDKGPVADPDPTAPDRAWAAGSDGSLYLAQSVDTGNFLDDMEAPFMQRLQPTASTFGALTRAGSNVDDYLTSLTLQSSGDGLVVRACGSDVDPFGFSGTDRYCYDSLHTASGAQLSGVPVEAKASAHAFTSQRAAAAYCTRDDTWLIRTDLNTKGTPDAPLGEVVLFPCPEAIALELDAAGDFLPVVRHAQRTYLLERNPAAVPPAGGESGAGAGGESGAGGEAGAAGGAGAGGAP